jgi:hypothetical protein
MLIAIIQDNEIIKIGNSNELFPNVSFPANGPESEFLIANSAMMVKQFIDLDETKQKLIPTDPYIKDNIVYTVDVVNKSEDELNADNERILTQLGDSIRHNRNLLLKDSDWTQIADAPVDKTAWANYRQELRDITLQESFPFDIIWPEKPTS